MKKIHIAAAFMFGFASVVIAQAQSAQQIKTRLSHLTGTPFVLVVSTIPAEIVSITCESWTMLGVGSYKGHNEFTIPTAPAGGASVAILDASGFNGYCKAAGSIQAHTDDGDFTCQLDRGEGSWDASTKLTCAAK